jgi:tol-pal system protein YbgF
MSKSLLLILVAAGLAGGCATVPPEEDPVYLKLTDMEARLIRIERVIDNQSLLEMAAQVDQLRTQTQALRGELETLRYDFDKSADRQREVYSDMDRRLQSMETRNVAPVASPRANGASALAGGSIPSGQLLVPGGSDRDNYQAAFDLLKEGRYQEAAGAFKQFLVVFSNSTVADNAQYWLAETYYVQRQFGESLPAFEKVLGDYPESRKVPDALLKIGYCNYELKQLDAARSALDKVVKQYPDTTAARLATQRLERMSQESS